MLELECFPTAMRPPEIVPGRPERQWMDRFAQRHPYRCLPLTMANTTGWEILCPMGMTLEWNGGKNQEDIKMTPDAPHPDFHEFVKSHFSHGVVTFHPGYLFRTPSRWSTPGRKPWTNTSALRMSSCIIFRPRSVRTSRQMLSLPSMVFSEPHSGGPKLQRMGSPSMFSTLITRAPRAPAMVTP